MESGLVKRQKVPLKKSGPTPASPRMSRIPQSADSADAKAQEDAHSGMGSASDNASSPTKISANSAFNSPDLEQRNTLLRSPDSSTLLSPPTDPLDETHGHANEDKTPRRMSRKSLAVAIQSQNSADADQYQPLRRNNTNTSTEYSFDENTGLRRRRRYSVEDEMKNLPRLVHRNRPFKQSGQEIAVVNKTLFRITKVQRIIRTLSSDWFHILLRQPTYQSLPLLLFFWTFFIVVFAFIYQKIDSQDSNVSCGLGQSDAPIAFAPAFAFSLETCTTVGYGLPNSTNAFFETECSLLQVAIYAQMMVSMCFNAFLFAFLFARLARCETRGAQVLFSDKAIVEVRDGKWLMHVRIYDFDAAKPLVEAHVRMYCVSWKDYERQTRDLIQPHLLHHMRILQPDDELGSQLYTSIPTNVTHHIDGFSPLAPLKMRKKLQKLDHGGLPLREADQLSGKREGVMCPACGETFGTVESLKKHVNYYRMLEELEPNFPVEGSHRDPKIILPKIFKPFRLTEDDIREQLKDKEIMVVMEAIEPMVSGTFQALQSYQLEDIHFGGRFEPCMSQQGGKIYVDVDKFHNILPPHENSIHRYSNYNGGYNHMMSHSLSYLPTFFRPPAPLGRNSDHNSGRSSSSPMPPSGRNRNRKTPSFFGRSRNKL